MKPREFEPFRAPQGLHHTLAVGMPAWALGLVVWLAWQPWPWTVLLVALVHSVLQSFWAQWKANTHRDPLIRFWLWVALHGAMTGVLFLLDASLWWAWALGATLQGQFTVQWQRALVGRARLFHQIDGVPDGIELEARVHDFHVDADFSRSDRRDLLASLAVLTALVVAVAANMPRGQTSLGQALVAGFVLAALVVASLTGIWRREVEALVYGRRLTWGEKLRPLLWSAGLVGVCGGLAWVLVALVPPLVDWEALFSGRPPVPVEAVELPPPPVFVEPPSPEGEIFPTLLMAFVARVLHFERLVLLVDLTVRALSVVIPGAVLLWLVAPLFRLLGPDNPRSPGRFRRWWALFLAQVRAFWANLFVLNTKEFWEPGGEHLGSSADLWLKTLARGGRKGRHRWPPLIAAFVRVLRWAEPRVPYRSGETTGAWCQRLVKSHPSLEADIGLVSTLLETELFSGRRLDDAQRRAFLAAVQRIVVS